MKWPKSEEKIEIGGGLQKLGGSPDDVSPPHRKSLAAPLGHSVAIFGLHANELLVLGEVRTRMFSSSRRIDGCAY